MAKILCWLILVAVFIFFPCFELEAAELSYSCSVAQGFHFEKDNQDTLGYINAIRIGESELKSDLSVTDPEDISNTVKVFGIVSFIYWKGGYADPIQFSSHVSAENKKLIASLVHLTLENTNIEFDFTIYSYDPKEKKYIKSFHSNQTFLRGLIYKSGGELHMAVDMDESMEVRSPKNYMFTIGIMPQDEQETQDEQEIHIAVSVSDKFVKKWGVNVGK